MRKSEKVQTWYERLCRAITALRYMSISLLTIVLAIKGIIETLPDIPKG